MLLAAGALALLTGVGVDTAYASHVLPSLILAGLGLGMAMAPAIASATYGVRGADAGVASAMVSTMQQIGGSIAVALLSTLAAGAASTYLTDHAPPTRSATAQAAIHGYHTAFWWAAGIFLAGSITCALLLRPGRQETGPQGRGDLTAAHPSRAPDADDRHR